MSTTETTLDIDEMIDGIDQRHELLQVAVDGPRVTIFTGRRAVREARRVVFVACLLAFAGGIVMTQISWTGWIVAAIALVVALVVPARLKAVPLIEFDADTDILTLFQAPSGHGMKLPKTSVHAVHGEYGARKGDGFSRLVAILEDGSESVMLSFSGTNDDVAEHACELLGAILSRPATYMASFGEDVLCYDPITDHGLSV
jgi:hypothetical protein